MQLIELTYSLKLRFAVEILTKDTSLLILF